MPSAHMWNCSFWNQSLFSSPTRSLLGIDALFEVHSMPTGWFFLSLPSRSMLGYISFLVPDSSAKGKENEISFLTEFFLFSLFD